MYILYVHIILYIYIYIFFLLYIYIFKSENIKNFKFTYKKYIVDFD